MKKNRTLIKRSLGERIFELFNILLMVLLVLIVLILCLLILLQKHFIRFQVILSV